MGTWTPGPGATAGDDIFTGDATGETADGLAGADTLNGGGGGDTLTGGAGEDTVNGDAGNDILVVNEGDLGFTEIYNGGADIDTLRIFGSSNAQILNFIFATITSIERIEYTSLVGGATNIQFGANQFGAGISLTAELVGSVLNDVFTISGLAGGTNLNLSGFTLTNWNPGDFVFFFGGANTDIFTGTSFNDTIDGRNGADTLTGGGGVDSMFGGDGADSLFGGAGDDFMMGGAGVDFLSGGADNDGLIGGGDADSLAGGAGTDLARYFDSPTGVTVNLQTGLGADGDAQGDTYVSIEAVEGSAFDDTLIGRNFVNNLLFGLDGNDTLMGGYGADVLDGGAGSSDLISYQNSLTAVDVRLFSGFAAGGEANGDIISNVESIVGSAFTDTLAGDANLNFIMGLAGNETITGREGSDTLLGGDGNDTLLGGADNDFLIGGAGADTLGGGSGNLDQVDYFDSPAGVIVNLQTGLGSRGHAEGDVYASIEIVTGSNFSDTIIGKNAAWDNFFDGGDGNDTLTGGGGNDTFAFNFNKGSDTVTDFMAGAASGDRISVGGFGGAFDSYAEVIAAASQVGADVVIDFGAGQTLTLQNVNLASLTSGDFIFA